MFHNNLKVAVYLTIKRLEKPFHFEANLIFKHFKTAQVAFVVSGALVGNHCPKGSFINDVKQVGGGELTH